MGILTKLLRSGVLTPVSHSSVFIQSFELGNLRELEALTDAPIVQLINADGKPYDFIVNGDSRTHADLATSGGLLVSEGTTAEEMSAIYLA